MDVHVDLTLNVNLCSAKKIKKEDKKELVVVLYLMNFATLMQTVMQLFIASLRPHGHT